MAVSARTSQVGAPVRITETRSGHSSAACNYLGWDVDFGILVLEPTFCICICIWLVGLPGATTDVKVGLVTGLQNLRRGTHVRLVQQAFGQ